MSLSQAARNPGSYLANSIQMYRALLTDPETFYDEHLVTHGISLEIVLVLFLGAVGFVGNVYALLRLEALFADLEVPLGQQASFALWGEVAAPLVGIVGLWIGLTTVLYLVGWLYTGVGEYYVLLKRCAWAMVPFLFANLIHAIAVAYAAFSLEPGDVSTEGISRLPEERAAFVWDLVATDPIVVAAVVVGVVFAVWTGYIGAFAVRDVRQLETGEAYRVAAVPTVAYVLFVLYEAATALL